MILKNTPIQDKLRSIIMLTCCAVLILLSTAYIIFEYLTFRQILKDNLSTLGLVIASNSSAAVAFDSQKDANETLNALRANKNIVAAALYDKSGKLFAKYPINIPHDRLPAGPAPDGYYFEDRFLHGFQPVLQGSTKLATLYIRSDLKSLDRQMGINAGIALFMIGASLLVAFILSNILQKAISGPILALEKTARIVSRKHDYSVRATKKGNDELGALTDAFNQMLTQIEAQNRELVKASVDSAKLAAIVESSGDAIIGTSLDLMITTWNNSARRIFGYEAEEMIGQPISRIIPDGLSQYPRLIGNQGMQALVESFETQYRTPENILIDISLTISPVKDASDHITGLSLIARDISLQKQHERQIMESELHLRLATEAAELGVFDRDILRDEMTWDKRSRELFDIYHGGAVNYRHDLYNRLHDDDKERIAAAFGVAPGKENSYANFNLEYRIITVENKTRWIRSIGRVYYGESGQPVRSVGVLLDITRHKTEEIKRNDFIAIISHELRTPLTSLKSYVQVLLGRARKDKDDFRINALTRAEIQSNKMASMINDFLSLARLEEGKIKLVKDKIELIPLLENIVEEALFLTTSHHIEFKAQQDIIVEADRDKISQVLINLVSNAVKYSPQGSRVTIDCEKIAGKVKISVTDQGIGISPQDQKRLFNRFYRVENEKAKTISGFGIGLYIVAEILRYHDSSVEVESTEGLGSTFSFCLDCLN